MKPFKTIKELYYQEKKVKWLVCLSVKLCNYMATVNRFYTNQKAKGQSLPNIAARIAAVKKKEQGTNLCIGLQIKPRS